MTCNSNFGGSSININGGLTSGDIDVYKVYIVPGDSGLLQIAFNTYWEGSIYPNKPDRYLLIHIQREGGLNSAISGSASMTGGGGYGEAPSDPGFFYLSVFSTFTPSIRRVIPSEIDGAYRIINLRGLNGTRVLSAAPFTVPEPGSLALWLSLGSASIGLLARRRRHRMR